MKTAVAFLAVSLLVGCTDSPDPVQTTLAARFTYKVEYGFVDPTNCPLREVRLIDRSTGDPERWKWSFPDGSTATERNPSYDPSGEVSPVTLTVFRGDDSHSVTKRIEWSYC